MWVQRRMAHSSWSRAMWRRRHNGNIKSTTILYRGAAERLGLISVGLCVRVQCQDGDDNEAWDVYNLFSKEWRGYYYYYFFQGVAKVAWEGRKKDGGLMWMEASIT